MYDVFFRRRRVLPVMAVTAMAGVAAVSPAFAGAQNDSSGTARSHSAGAGSAQLIHQDDFNGDRLDQAKWKAMEAGPSTAPDTHSQVRYVRSGVRLGQGYLHITTERHCVKKVSDPITKGNASVGKCVKKHQRPVYTTGRVDGNAPMSAVPNSDWEFRMRAKLPDSVEPGTRFALWARNAGDGGGDCHTNVPNGPRIPYGEADLLEWYGSRPSKAHSTTHLGCAGGTTSTNQSPHSTQIKPHSQWFEWAARRTGRTITYLMKKDGQAFRTIGSDTCGEGPFAGVSTQACDDILGRRFNAIVQGEVFSKGSPQGGPNDGKNFNPETMLVDWVRIYRLS